MNKYYLFSKKDKILQIGYLIVFLLNLGFNTAEAEALSQNATAADAIYNTDVPGDFTFTAPTATITIGATTDRIVNSFINTEETTTAVSHTTGTLEVLEDITSATNAPLTFSMSNTSFLTLKGNVHESSSSTGAIIFNINGRSLTISGDNKTIESAITGSSGGTLTIAGNEVFTDTVAVPTINISAGKTATFNQSVEGTITTTGTGSIILNSTTTAPTLTVGSGGTATLNGVVTATTVNIGTGSTAIVNANSEQIANLTLASGSSLQFGTDSMNSSVALIAGSANETLASIDANSSISFPHNFNDGETQILFATTESSNADLIARLNTVTKDSPLVNYVVTTGGADSNTAIVTAIDKSISETRAEMGSGINDATALFQARNSVYASTDTAAQTALNSILNTNAGSKNFSNQASPQTGKIRGSSIEVKAAANKVQNIIATRTASLRTGEAYATGVAAGNEALVRSTFLQGFGSSVDQKTVGTHSGYDAETAGFALGFDTKTYGGVVFGVSYANISIDVVGKGTGSSKNKIKKDSGSLYSDYTTDFGYIEGSLTYGRSDNNTSRILSVDSVNRSYAANFNSDSFSFRLFGGIPFNLGVGFYATPFVGTTISMIKSDSYQESSSVADDALALSYADSTVNSQVGTLGFKFQEVFEGDILSTTAELKLAVNQEFGDDKITNTNTYQGGGSSFKNIADIAKTSGNIGLGLDFVYAATSFSIGYEVDIRDQYLGHSAQAKLAVQF